MARRLTAALLSMFVFGACRAGHSGNRATPTSAPVTERDFHITAPASVRAGNVLFRVRNDGPVEHELIVVRARGALPLRADGLTVDEEALAGATVAALEPGRAGSVRTLAVDLAPGHYILFCNMYGHYLAGMHHVLVVP